MPERHPTREEIAEMTDESLLQAFKVKEWGAGDREAEKIVDELQRRGITFEQ